MLRGKLEAHEAVFQLRSVAVLTAHATDLSCLVTRCVCVCCALALCQWLSLSVGIRPLVCEVAWEAGGSRGCRSAEECGCPYCSCHSLVVFFMVMVVTSCVLCPHCVSG